MTSWQSSIATGLRRVWLVSVIRDQEERAACSIFAGTRLVLARSVVHSWEWAKPHDDQQMIAVAPGEALRIQLEHGSGSVTVRYIESGRSRMEKGQTI